MDSNNPSEQQAAAAKGLTTQAMLTELGFRGRFVIGEFTTLQLLEELATRGGPVGILGEAGYLQTKKAGDYNDNGVKLDDYFPFGQLSYAQMMHVKTQRLISLSRMEAAGQTPNFEGILDTLKDVINYASFNADWLKRTKTTPNFSDNA